MRASLIGGDGQPPVPTGERTRTLVPAEQATWFDDDIGFKAEGVETLGWNTAQILAFFVRRLASLGSASARARRLSTFTLRGQRLVLGFMATHAAMGARFAERIGRRWPGSGWSPSPRRAMAAAARLQLQ